MSNKYYTKKQQRDDQIYYTLETIKYYAQKIFETIILLAGLYMMLLLSTL